MANWVYKQRRNGILSSRLKGLHGPLLALPRSVLMIETVNILDLVGNMNHVINHGNRISFDVFLKHIYLVKNRFFFPVLQCYLISFISKKMGFENTIYMNFYVPNVLDEV